MEDRSKRQYHNGYRICEVDGCKEIHVARGTCRMHYNMLPEIKERNIKYHRIYRAKPKNKEAKRLYQAMYRQRREAESLERLKKFIDKNKGLQ